MDKENIDIAVDPFITRMVSEIVKNECVFLHNLLIYINSLDPTQEKEAIGTINKYISSACAMLNLCGLKESAEFFQNALENPLKDAKISTLSTEVESEIKNAEQDSRVIRNIKQIADFYEKKENQDLLLSIARTAEKKLYSHNAVASPIFTRIARINMPAENYELKFRKKIESSVAKDQTNELERLKTELSKSNLGAFDKELFENRVKKLQQEINAATDSILSKQLAICNPETIAIIDNAGKQMAKNFNEPQSATNQATAEQTTAIQQKKDGFLSRFNEFVRSLRMSSKVFPGIRSTKKKGPGP